MSTEVATEETGLTIGAAAEHLGIHPRTLRRYISDGRITATRYTSQVVRITQDELGKFREDNIRVDTGTGTAYVPRPKPARTRPRKARSPMPPMGRSFP